MKNFNQLFVIILLLIHIQAPAAPTCSEAIIGPPENRPLPLDTPTSISPTQWASEFTQKYIASLRFDFAANTPKPDFSFGQHPSYKNLVGYEKADDVLITGKDHYSMEVVLHNLGLTNYISKISKAVKIISVGEGMSELAPNLANEGFNIWGVDIWYEAKNLPKSAEESRKKTMDGDDAYEYVTENRAILQAADATSLPYQSGSIDLVLSHQLINNLKDKNAFLAIQEMVRIVKKGGQVRIAFHDPYERFNLFIKLLEAVPWLRIEKIVTGVQATRFGDISESLLIIDKTGDAP